MTDLSSTKTESIREKRKLSDDPDAKRPAFINTTPAFESSAEPVEEVDEDLLPVISPFAKRKEKQDGKRTCPYLDTINRAVLDFDFEKLCSVSLSNLNVYACLVCGKYFQGRGRHSHAYFHALHCGHQVFMNLNSSKFYCLPDDYEIIDSSLDDIKYCLNPTFTELQIAQFDTVPRFTRAQDGSEYLPGVVGLNNIKSTDYLNVIVQALNRASEFRNFFVRGKGISQSTNLVKCFAELVRKIWNPRNFRSHVSPHELLQAITISSGKKYSFGAQSDPIEFLSWLLNTIHKDIGGTRAPNSSIVFESFQGELKITTEKLKQSTDGGKDESMDAEDAKKTGEDSTADGDTEITEEKKPFLFLSLDIPPPPLFKDELERNVIPNVPLFVCLEKFDGKTTEITMNREKKKYVLTKLPKYLILHLKRFKKNNWFMEKNPTIVTFPVKNLEMKDYVSPEALAANPETKYDLLASICHEGLPGKGNYHVHIYSKPHDQWFDLRDLICTEVLPQLITLSEAYVQIYERKA